MIIGFCGRLRSGKTELAKICEAKGYERLSFGTPLKELCAHLLGISVEQLNEYKNNHTPIDFCLKQAEQQYLSETTNILIDVISAKCADYTIPTVRDMLQVIGTDIIRQYNEDWHVNKIMEYMIRYGDLLDSTHVPRDWVFDDVRFPNEKRFIEEMCGDCWFVTRPIINNVSNHPSETSIPWSHCWNKIIINDSSLNYLPFKWETFMEDYGKKNQIRENEFNRILQNGTLREVEALTSLDMLFLSKWLFTYIPIDFENKPIQKASLNQDNTVIVTYEDGTMEIIENPLNIEDLKQYIPYGSTN